MTRYTDPRRPTKTSPDYIRNGVLICTRNCSGSYTHVDQRFNTWLIERTYNPETCEPTGMWTYRRDDRPADDIFCSKSEAVEVLQINLYGAYTREKGYSR